jgi:hypothetical protein
MVGRGIDEACQCGGLHMHRRDKDDRREIYFSKLVSSSRYLLDADLWYSSSTLLTHQYLASGSTMLFPGLVSGLCSDFN